MGHPAAFGEHLLYCTLYWAAGRALWHTGGSDHGLGGIAQNDLHQGGLLGGPILAAGGVLLAGGRNVGLASLAGKLRRAGLAEGEIAAALLAANRERCSPPLAEREVLAIARSIARYAPGPGEQCWAMKQAWKHAIEHRRRKCHGR
jgi:hypothetical protein